MKTTPTQAPPAQVILNAYPPAPARIVLAYRPAPGRLVLTLLLVVVCWGPIPWLVWLPPHYPWPLAAFVAGAYLAFRTWTGRYQVRSFTGRCPRCRRHLRLDAGTVIDLPHTLTCFGCHFEPRLEVSFRTQPAPSSTFEPVRVRHLDPDCTGDWRLSWFCDDPYLGCPECGARHFATPQARKVADEENSRGELLDRLAREGRFMD